MNSENDPLIKNLGDDANRSRPAFSTELDSRIREKINAERLAAQPKPRLAAPAARPSIIGNVWQPLARAGWIPQLAIAAVLMIGVTLAFVAIQHRNQPQRDVAKVVPDVPRAVKPPELPPQLAASFPQIISGIDELKSLKLFPLKLKFSPTVSLELPRQQVRSQEPKVQSQVAAKIRRPARTVDLALIDMIRPTDR